MAWIVRENLRLLVIQLNYLPNYRGNLTQSKLHQSYLQLMLRLLPLVFFSLYVE